MLETLVGVTSKIPKGLGKEQIWYGSHSPVFSFSWWGKSSSFGCEATEVVMVQLARLRKARI
jgi:hypothetical protein